MLHNPIVHADDIGRQIRGEKTFSTTTRRKASVRQENCRKSTPTITSGPLISPRGQMPVPKLPYYGIFGNCSEQSLVHYNTQLSNSQLQHGCKVLSRSLRAESSFPSSTAINTRTQIQEQIAMTGERHQAAILARSSTTARYNKYVCPSPFVQISARQVDLKVVFFSLNSSTYLHHESMLKTFLVL